MIVDIGDPNPKQMEFMLAREKYIAYGGARGGGKSWVVRLKAKLLALMFSGIKILIVRRTYAELKQNHIDTMRTELKLLAKYNKTDKEFTFFNGSKIRFGYCKYETDVEQYQGAEFDVIFIDEACLLSEEQIKVFNACVRGINTFPKRIYYTLNPGGQSHGYFKRLFIDRKFNSDENPEEYRFIQSLVTDNKALMEIQPDYVKQLEALPHKLKLAWRFGRWDVFKGMFFEDFRTEVDVEAAANIGLSPEEALKYHRYTHVIKPFTPPMGWTYYRSYDFGYGKPFACLWWAVDYEGVAYLIKEYYGCTKTPNEGVKMSPDEQFKEIAAMERTDPLLAGRNFQGVADPAIWDGSLGMSVNDAAEKHGIFFDKGNNSRVAGWMQMHIRFMFDERGKAKLYVFSDCEHTIRTLPLMMYDEHKTEDLNTNLEDHIADAMRYFCMENVIEPTIIANTDYGFKFNPLNM